jgi:hypothetical protein
MSRRLLGLILVVIVGQIIGYLAGDRAFALFDKTVPPAVITNLVRTGAQGTYILFGVVLGLVIAAWSVLVAWCARFFLSGSKATAKS